MYDENGFKLQKTLKCVKFDPNGAVDLRSVDGLCDLVCNIIYIGVLGGAKPFTCSDSVQNRNAHYSVGLNGWPGQFNWSNDEANDSEGFSS